MLASFDLGGSVLAGDFCGSEWGGVDFLGNMMYPFLYLFSWLLLVGGWFL